MVHQVRVCAVSYAPPFHDHHADGVNLEPLREMVGKVVEQERPDFLCFPEVCACYAKGFGPGIKSAPEIEPFVAVVGKIAKEFDVNLIVPLMERWNGRVYNSTPIVDRRGKHVLTYRKVYPTIGEMDEGITPGWDVPVADCDGVNVGVSVCFDANYPQIGEQLFQQGCRLMFWPSMFWGGQHLQYWALRYGFAVVVAYATENGVIDHTGRYLVKQGLASWQVRADHLPAWAAANVNTDCEVLHLDGNMKKFKAIQAKYSRDTLVEVFDPEGYFFLSSLTDRITTADIIKEFELVTLRDYLNRSVKMRDDILVRAHLPPKTR